MNKKVTKKERRINDREQRVEETMMMDPAREGRLAMIQMLIPLGLEAVKEELEREVEGLAGPRYSRNKEMYRWGENRGSVFMGDQKVSVRVPRVRRKEEGEEVPLVSYARLQNRQLIEEAALRRVINGISGNKYEKAVLSVPETFGISRSSVSKKWIRASRKKLAGLMERDLGKYDIVAMILDGKTFGDNEMIVALGVTVEGEKIILGFIEADSENFIVCRDFLEGLLERGLNRENEILVVMDGGKGIRKAVESVLGEKGVIQRCQWHKRENVVGYMKVAKRDEWRRKMQSAYEAPSYEKAKNRLLRLKSELRILNMSAAKSLEEGMEETLTLHRLGMYEKLGVHLKTTNLIEHVNRMLEDYTGRVARWRNSEQRQRWVATALLEIEPGFRKVKGYRHLPQLRESMRRIVGRRVQTELKKAA